MDRRSRVYEREFRPETLALGYGYKPALSEGAVKPPVFLTSTFQFESASHGMRFFEVAYGLANHPGMPMGLIYSRLNNPNLQIWEERIAAWEGLDQACAFSSGMAAISTTLLAHLRPGDVIISTLPVYGGTHYLFEKILPEFGIRTLFVPAGDSAPAMMRERIVENAGKVRLLYVETPANPSNMLTDIAAVVALGREFSKPERQVLVGVDNTFLGPVFQQAGKHGADLVFYSATKFLGGHSDLIAGVTVGRSEIMAPVANFRSILGTMAEPFTAWLLLRSLETVSIRMVRQAKSARKIAEMLKDHPKVRQVYYPGLLKEGTNQYRIYRQQCSGAGSLIAFEVQGDEKEAFAVLDHFEICKLAVSLGGTETLVEHPLRMTHADVPPAQLALHGVNGSMIRMSVGLEHVDDLKADLAQALDAI
jgi:methionine-gamma-lyase